MASGILLIGPWKIKASEFGAELVADLSTAIKKTKAHSFDVLGVSLTILSESKFPRFFEELCLRNPSLQIVAVIPPEYNVDRLVELYKRFSIFKIISSFQDPSVEEVLKEAQTEVLQIKQDIDVQKLIEDQNQRLRRLQADLELRVATRTEFLTETRQKLFNAGQRLEDLKKSIFAIQQANTISEIEVKLSEVISIQFQITMIRINCPRYEQDGEFKIQQDLSELKVSFHRSLLFERNIEMGTIYFIRGHAIDFLREEKDFLNRLAEVVSLAVIRLDKRRLSAILKEQWNATFQAIVDPVILIDSSYNLVQTNKEFINQSQLESHQKCYHVLFQRSEPCTHCQLGKNFRLLEANVSKNSFDVTSNHLPSDFEESARYVNIYHDITDKLRMENQIIEKAKLAELGIIGSSIAHELNNPLAGVLSYCQLLLMDTDKESPLFQDLKEIESAVKKCRDIILNLLSFARSPGHEESSPVSILKICQKAISIFEIKSKPLGVPVTFENHLAESEDKAMILGKASFLLQGLSHLLQSSWGSLIQSPSGIPRPLSWIRLVLTSREDGYELLITDNGAETLTRTIGLSIPLAYQIFRDHSGDLSIYRSDEGLNIAKISFSRPVLLK